MPVDVHMPQLGESVVEGTVTKWLKSVGDRVEEFDALVEINTDKVDTEIPSPADGVLSEILVTAGSIVQAGVVLARLEVNKEPTTQPPAPPPAPAAEGKAVNTPGPRSPAGNADIIKDRAVGEVLHQTQPGQHPVLGFVSPIVSRIAREENIDLRQVKGSGENGRITKDDLLRHLEERSMEARQAPGKTAAPSPAHSGPAQTIPAQAVPAQSIPPSSQPGDEIVPLTNVRRAIAEHMVFSERTSPHVTTVMEADLSRVVAHRQANKSGFAQNGANLTFTAYFVAAAVAALKAFPIVNSSWSDQGIVIHRAINVGMAASLGEEGLIVPVIKQADGLSLLGLARAVNDLAGRARSRKLLPDEVKGGTFTITNHGITGSLFATPIINQPQCAILGVGAVQKRVMVIQDGPNDAIAIRPMVYLSLTFDHRILDGAMGDNFLAKVVESLQNY